MKYKHLISILLAICILFLAGCKENIDSPKDDKPNSYISTGKAPSDTVRVLYSSKDSLDPYTCITEQNSILSHLIFEPLLVLNNNYEIEYRLAKNVFVENKTCTVTLRDAKFSDGSAVTPQDIIFSFEKAKKSTTRHASALKYAASATVSGADTITINLTRNDIYFANLLTFPIMKTGTDELKNVDNQALCPIGAGRYVFNNETNQLTINTQYYGDISAIKNIQTVDAPDNESVDQAVKAGMVDYYFTDLSSNTIPKMNGNTADVSQTRLVFLGINPNNPQLSNSLFRQAISSAIDRQTVCSSAYFGKALPALGPFPTLWNPANGYMNIQSIQNSATAIRNIELAGFTKKDESGNYLLKNNNPITFSLLVNSSNASRVSAAEKIAENIRSIGIGITIKSVSDAQYKSMLDTKQYDLYIGEVRMEENMDLGGLIYLNSSYYLSGNASTPNSTAFDTNTATSSTKPIASSILQTTSIDSSSDAAVNPGEITLTTAAAYKGFYNGQYSLQDLIIAFTAELPVIPVCFKNGLVIYSDRFGNGITPSRTDLFHGIQLLK